MLAKTFLNSKTQSQRITNILSEIWLNSKYNRKDRAMSLQEFIDNYTKVNIDEEENEALKSFLEMVQVENLKLEIPGLMLKLIPKDLLSEVQFYIEKQYQGDAKAYFKSVQIYFNTFTRENLVKCNIKDSKIYQDSTAAGRRKMNRERKHNLWHASVLLKLVGKKRAKYSCNTIFNEFKESKKKEFEFIENCKLVGKDRKVYDLKKCVRTAEQSIAEKINLIRVQEKIAQDNGWTWCFITLTLEGQFHPNPLKGKDTYNGVSPRESAKLMNEDIKRVRSLMHKWEIKAGRDYMGCSSAEAFQDGCLHKHLMMFCDQKNIETIKLAFQWHFPNMINLPKSFIVESEENKQKPWKTEADEYVKGKFRERASSYVFKYVMKSITSYDSSLFASDGQKFYGYEDYIKNGWNSETPVEEKTEQQAKLSKENKNAVLNNAFRSYNFIRGFSFFGMDNCLTKFRFIARNIKNMDLPYEISSLVIENNLYELLTKGLFELFENVYAKETKVIQVEDKEDKTKMIEKEITESRTFVGCKFNGRMYFKRFFSLVRTASKNLSKTEIAVNWLSMKKRENKLVSITSGLVILNHNHTREPQTRPKPNPFTLIFNVNGTEVIVPGAQI